jgi:polyisoprenyl-phosphate glycosyltransferase
MNVYSGISIVLPVYNEAGNLRPMFRAVVEQLEAIGEPYELIFVDDDSKDQSLAVLRELAAANPHVRVVSFSRNFGHQAAITAGLQYARGRAIITMDSDMQHPPELIPHMIAAWREGAQVVFTVRHDAEETSWFKRWTSKTYYQFLNSISDVAIVPGAADFRLLDRVAADALLAMPERSRFLRGMISWLGFRQVGLNYKAKPRLHGASKYSLRKMLSLAMRGITSFSVVPLRVSAVLGLIAAGVGLPYGVWAVYAKFFTNTTVPGWSSLMVAILFLGGVQLMSIGVIGEYIGRIYTEVKARPHFLAKELIGFDGLPRLDASPQARDCPDFCLSKNGTAPLAGPVPAPHFSLASSASEATRS